MFKNNKILFAIGITEILIGGITLTFNLITLALKTNSKSAGVLLFVVITALTSSFIGIELLQLKRRAWELLVYFSSVIVLSKILILLDVIELNGAFTTAVPDNVKIILSIVYHVFLIYYLRQENVQKIFVK